MPITGGQVRLDARDLTRMPAYTRLAKGLAFVPQTENIFATMTVQDNLRLAADSLPERRTGEHRIAALLRTFPDLARQQRLLAGRLSGGQRQMLAVARALVGQPRVLMLDEPSAGLSPKLVADVFAQLARIRDDGVAIVLVEQNVRAALAIADRALVLVEGSNRHEGPAKDLADDPTLGELYLAGRRQPTAVGA